MCDDETYRFGPLVTNVPASIKDDRGVLLYLGRALLKQGVKSQDGPGCRYRTDAGFGRTYGCGIGLGILDSEYRESFEFVAVKGHRSALRVQLAVNRTFGFPVSVDLLSRVQKLHDTMPVAAWAGMLAGLLDDPTNWAIHHYVGAPEWSNEEYRHAETIERLYG